MSKVNTILFRRSLFLKREEGRKKERKQGGKEGKKIACQSPLSLVRLYTSL